MKYFGLHLQESCNPSENLKLFWKNHSSIYNSTILRILGYLGKIMKLHTDVQEIIIQVIILIPLTKTQGTLWLTHIQLSLYPHLSILVQVM